MDMSSRVTNTLGAVMEWDTETLVNQAQQAMSTGDLAEQFLRRLELGTLKRQKTFVTHTALTLVLLRACEMTEMDCIECDEDHFWVNTETFQRRRTRFIGNLSDIVTNPAGLLEIARTSAPALSGLSLAHAQLGWKLPIVQAAWAEVKGACAPLLYAEAVKGMYR